jgi:uncharacterized membrane protein
MDETPRGPSNAAPPPPPPAAPSSAPANKPAGVVSDNRNIMIILSYLGLLALIPLLVEKDDREVQWHAKHGLVLFVAFFAAAIVIFVVSFIPWVGCITGLFGIVIWLAYLVVAILCIVKGINGERFTIPGISEFADRF